MIKGYIEKNNSNIKPPLMLTDNRKGNDRNQNGQSVVTDNSDYGEHIPHLKNSEIIGNLEKIEHIIKGFRTIVFIFIVISTTFRSICPLAFFRCLSNSRTFTELLLNSRGSPVLIPLAITGYKC